MEIGIRVRKNYKAWTPNTFDAWGAGRGVGIVAETPEGLPIGADEVFVRWPAGACSQKRTDLIVAGPPAGVQDDRNADDDKD